MKYFKEMIEEARMGGIHKIGSSLPLSLKEQAELEKSFFSLVERASVFVLAPEMVSGEYKILNGMEEILFDAPFAAFALEGFDCPLFDIINASKITDTDVEMTEEEVIRKMDGLYMDVYCTLSLETSPRKFTTFAYVKARKDEKDSGTGVFLMEQVNTGVAMLVRKINSSNMQLGVESLRERVKIGFGKDKRTHTIRKVIYCKPKNSPQESAFTGRKIEYSHRFLRRGHWRSHPGKIGKDRSGDYRISGQTWVMEAEVGDESLPLVKKTRVVEEMK